MKIAEFQAIWVMSGCKEGTNFNCIIELSIFFSSRLSMPERIYNPITAMGFSAMFTFQLDNTKR